MNGDVMYNGSKMTQDKLLLVYQLGSQKGPILIMFHVELDSSFFKLSFPKIRMALDIDIYLRICKAHPPSKGYYVCGI